MTEAMGPTIVMGAIEIALTQETAHQGHQTDLTEVATISHLLAEKAVVTEVGLNLVLPGQTEVVATKAKGAQAALLRQEAAKRLNFTPYRTYHCSERLS